MKRIFNWIPDSRERLALHRHVGVARPRGAFSAPYISLCSGFPRPPTDQGDEGDCTGQGARGAAEFAGQKQGQQFVPLSAQFAYYLARSIEGTVSTDAGATITDVVKGMGLYGVCPEADDLTIDATLTMPPSTQAYAEAKSFSALSAFTVSQDMQTLYACYANGLPVIFGMSVYSSFESDATASTGIVTIPNTQTEALLGGHCTLLCGHIPAGTAIGGRTPWTTDQDYEIGRNSWGDGWGDGGYYYIPTSMILNPDIASDFWCIPRVGLPAALPKLPRPRTVAPNGLTVLLVGGFTDSPGDGSPIWDVGAALAAIGCDVIQRAWDTVAPTDFAGVNILVDFSWGKAGAKHAMDACAIPPNLLAEFTICGVPCALLGQFDLFGDTYWQEPANVAQATSYNLSGLQNFPVGLPIRNTSVTRVDVDISCSGAIHRTAPTAALPLILLAVESMAAEKML